MCYCLSRAKTRASRDCYGNSYLFYVLHSGIHTHTCTHTCACRAGGEWALYKLLTFQIPCRTPPASSSAKPEERPEWSHLQALMDYTAASISLCQCYWWMRFSVNHRASTPEECCLIIKWWMSARSSFSEPGGFDVLCSEKASQMESILINTRFG